MSRIALSPPASGTATFTLSAPETNTDRTLNLPDAAGTMYNQGNILGTVSESSGVPTGAIIERGSNANGEFVKYADGTMICWFNGTTTSLAIDTAYVSLFQGTVSVVLPAAFVNSDYAGASLARWGTGRSWANLESSTETNASIRAMDIVSRASGTQTQLQFLAIGRWF